jgi:hypothetical protein
MAFSAGRLPLSMTVKRAYRSASTPSPRPSSKVEADFAERIVSLSNLPDVLAPCSLSRGNFQIVSGTTQCPGLKGGDKRPSVIQIEELELTKFCLHGRSESKDSRANILAESALLAHASACRKTTVCTARSYGWTILHRETIQRTSSNSLLTAQKGRDIIAHGRAANLPYE